MTLIAVLSNNHLNCSQYCNAPSGQEASLMIIRNNVLRATVIDVFPLTTVSALCSAMCTANSSCVYIGLNFSNKTCSLLASTGGPSRTFLFDQIYAVQYRLIEV